MASPPRLNTRRRRMSSFDLHVGDTFQASMPMSQGEVWEVEQVGRSEAKLSGVWYRHSQIKRWIDTGQLVNTKRASAQE